MENKIILALTTVGATLPSIATVRIQRKEQDEKQKEWLAWCGLIAILTVVGAIKYEPLMWLGILLMVGSYLYALLAPKEMI